MNYTIPTGIAEDHRLVRQGFIKMLGDYPNIQILFEAANGQELIKCLRGHKPAIILLDISMPVLKGPEAMKTTRERWPKLKIIVISAYAGQGAIPE